MRKSVTGVVVCNKSVFLVELSLFSRLGLETDFSQLSSYGSLFGEARSQGPLEVTGADWFLFDLVKKAFYRVTAQAHVKFRPKILSFQLP